MTDAPTPPAPVPEPPPPTAPPRRWDWRPKLKWFAAEYFIVVLGVLTAVAINAWWVETQEHEVETETLRELRDALTRDLGDIAINVRIHERAAASAALLQAHMQARRPYADTLDAHFGHVLLATFAVRDETAYETLKQRGLDTVTDDSLRAAIGRLYGVSYPTITPFQDRTWDFVDSQQTPFYNANFRDIRFTQSATPVDYPALLTSTEFAALLDWRGVIDGIHSRVGRELEEEVATLVAQIDAELEDR